jgi:hypothetical protein
VSSLATKLGNLLLTVATGPGILAHEYAHYAACRLAGVTVLSPPALRPFADSAVLEHERVDRFGADLAIALAPLVVNSVLAFLAFLLAGRTSGTASAVCLWLGVCFGFTALPSEPDTRTLRTTAQALPRGLSTVAYPVALSVRTATLSLWVTGVVTFVWTLTLLAWSGAAV